MPDLLEITETEITRHVAGVERKFKLLSGYERAELLRADLAARQELHRQHKAKLVENLKLANMTGPDAFTELEEFDRSYPTGATDVDWEIFVNNALNEVAIYTVSLSGCGAEAEAVAKQASLSLADKAKICGLTVTKREPPAAAAAAAVQGGAPDPTNPTAVYATLPPPGSIGQAPSPSAPITSAA